MKKTAKKTGRHITRTSPWVFRERVPVKTPRFRAANPLFTLAHLSGFDKPLEISRN